MRKVLILGGFGFLGKHLNRVVDKTKYQVHNESKKTGVDLLSYKNIKDKLKSIAPDVIINCTAHTGSLHYVSEFAADVMHDNTLFYINLYKAVRDIDLKPLIVNPISNCSYPGIIDVQYEKNWWDGAIHDSVLPYGMSKKVGFALSKCYEIQYGIQSINLILPNAYGPLDHNDPNKVHALNGMIIRMIQAQKNQDREFVIWGTGTPIREWIYMEDAARLMLKAIDLNVPNPLNLAQEEGLSIKQTAEMVKKILGYSGELTHDLSKKDGAPVKILGKELFNKTFPEFEFTSYEDGIRKTIDYYLEIL